MHPVLSTLIVLARLAAQPAPAAKEQIPTPLTDAEKNELASRCKPVLKAFERAVDRSKAIGTLGRTVDGLNQVTAHPPAMKGRADRCLDLFTRDTRGYVIDTLGSEVRASFAMLTTRLGLKVKDGAPLCPTALRPLPASVPQFYQELSDADFADPGWTCLGARDLLQRTSVQLEYRQESTGTAVLVARGAPFQADRWVEWEVRCTVQGAKLSCTDPTRR